MDDVATVDFSTGAETAGKNASTGNGFSFPLYPRDKFPNISLRPEVEKRHEKHLDALETCIIGYTRVGHRSPSLYDWLLRVFENLALSTADSGYLDSLAIAKTKLAMFVVLIDDTVDSKETRNLELFEEIAKLPFYADSINTNQLSERGLNYLNFTKEVWTAFINEIKTYPYFKKYYELFLFDVHQLINSMRYSRLANTMPNSANTLESTTYVHHSMIVFLQADLDLMCSKNFNDRELSKLREMLYLSQKLAKIGNLYSTYPRELLESDVSSEIVIRFLNKYGLDFDFRINKFLNREKRYPKFEELLKREGTRLHKKISKYSSEIKSIDMDRFLKEREFIQAAYLSKADYW